MAEGLVKHYLRKEWKAYSAGTEPSGYVHPMAIQVMAELGIDIAGRKSKSTEKFRGKRLDLVIIVCDDAAENCPLWLGQGRRVHLGFPDPARAMGSEEERLSVFRQVRDDVRRALCDLLVNGKE